MNEPDVVKALAALAQETRLKLFRLLVVAGKAGLTPSSLSETLDVPTTALSFHLKELHFAGLVTSERDGRYVIYRAELARMNALLAFLTAECCQGEECAELEVPACLDC